MKQSIGTTIGKIIRMTINTTPNIIIGMVLLKLVGFIEATWWVVLILPSIVWVTFTFAFIFFALWVKSKQGIDYSYEAMVEYELKHNK